MLNLAHPWPEKNTLTKCFVAAPTLHPDLTPARAPRRRARVAMDRALAVPMVTARVSRRETYAQIVTALTALDEASASVFDGVAARVDAQRARLADIDARLARANARIAALAANAGEAPDGSAAHGSTRTPIVVTARGARFPSRATSGSEPALHHDARSILRAPAEDVPRIIPRRTQDEHDAAEAELFQRREEEADVLELFMRLRVPKRRDDERDAGEEEVDGSENTADVADASRDGPASSSRPDADSATARLGASVGDAGESEARRDALEELRESLERMRGGS